MLNTSPEHDVNQPPSDVLLVYRKKAVTISILKYSCRLYKAQPYKVQAPIFGRRKQTDASFGQRRAGESSFPPRFGESLLPIIAFTFKWSART